MEVLRRPTGRRVTVSDANRRVLDAILRSKPQDPRPTPPDPATPAKAKPGPMLGESVSAVGQRVIQDLTGQAPAQPAPSVTPSPVLPPTDNARFVDDDIPEPTPTPQPVEPPARRSVLDRLLGRKRP